MFLAEILGTFLLVFGGLASVAGVIALEAFSGLFQVAAVWGLSLTLGIYLCGGISGGHFNPAITLAFATQGGFSWKRVPLYISGQMLGAFLAAVAVYALFGDAISAYEANNAIVRGTAGSEASGMIFGEYFPNPGGKPLPSPADAWGTERAFFAELLGTALLALAVFGLTDKRNSVAPSSALVAPAISATLALLICIFAPLTMACFNPARDLAPRLFSMWAGWGEWAFQANGWGWLIIYILAPCLGAQLGAWIWKRLQP